MSIDHPPRDHMLDRLADLTLPLPDQARMQADIARARARFVEAGLAAHAPPAAGGFMSRWWKGLRFGAASLAGGLLAAGVAAIVILPLARDGLPGTESGPALSSGVPPVARAGQGAGTEPAPSLAATGARPDVTLPKPAAIALEFPELDLAAPSAAAPPVAELSAAEPADPQLASGIRRGPTKPDPAAPKTTLPRIGPAPRGPGFVVDPASNGLTLPGEDAVFSGSMAFTLAGDQDGIWLESDAGRLAIPLDAVAPGTALQMAELFLLPARNGLPSFLVIMGERDASRSWQIFRVEAGAVTFDPALTGLLHEAVTPGQVEAMLAQLQAPD